MANIDPKPKHRLSQPLLNDEAHPDMPLTKAQLFSQTTKKQAPIANGAERSPISSSVSQDSLPGWVKKNVNHFEPTEGRL